MKVHVRAKRYALLLAARDSDYVKKVYGGYFNVFVSAFAEEGNSAVSLALSGLHSKRKTNCHSYNVLVKSRGFRETSRGTVGSVQGGGRGVPGDERAGQVRWLRREW